MSATVVLVHGAWHGAWCWERVVPLLPSAVAIDLPGHGSDAGPLGDLHGDAAAVTRVLDGIDGEVVLVGHSYGGAVITEAGVHPSVRQLVYLCAFNLDAAESCMSAATDSAVDLPPGDGRPRLADAFIVDDAGLITLDPAGAAACFYNDCDPDTTDWAVDQLGPQPMATLTQAPAAVAWRERPSTYVVCTDDLAVPPSLQRALADRCDTQVVWPVSHSPFLSRPDFVAGLLTECAVRGAT